MRYFEALVMYSVTTPANGGTAVLNPDSTITYTPPAGAAIGDTEGFDYVVSDGRGGSDTGHITVTVGGDPCLDAGGFTVSTDPAGDTTPVVGQPQHDVRSASIAQTADGKFVFILKMTHLNSPLPANTTWPMSYTGGDGAVRFVRMSNANVVPPTDPPRFAFGNGSTVSPFVVGGSPADSSSCFDANGTLRIVVAGSAIGDPLPGQELKALLTRIRIESPDGSALTPDNMPDNNVASGSYEVVSCEP